MTKQVLSVGQCAPDHASLSRLIERNFNAKVVPAHLPTDTLEKLRSDRYDLVCVNRKLDADYSDGMEIIRQIKGDPGLAAIPVLLISNYVEHQNVAVAAGAEPGFGKMEYELPETLEKLRKYLG